MFYVMTVHELFFGVLSIISFVLLFQFKEPAYKFAEIVGALLVLIVVYFSSTINKLKSDSDFTKSELKKLSEKLKIHEKLAEHDVRIKVLEDTKR